MTRCQEFYVKWECEPNWCEKADDTVRRINDYIDFIKEHPPMGKISERAARPLLYETDPVVKARAINHIEKALNRKTPQGGVYKRTFSAKDVQDAITKVKEQIRAGARKVEEAQHAETLGEYKERMKPVWDAQAEQMRVDEQKIAEQFAVFDAERKAREKALDVEVKKIASTDGLEAAQAHQKAAWKIEDALIEEENRKIREQREADKKAREAVLDPDLKEVARLDDVIQSLRHREEVLVDVVFAAHKKLLLAREERKNAEFAEQAAIGWYEQQVVEKKKIMGEIAGVVEQMDLQKRKRKGGNPSVTHDYIV
jgi:hypothetical protein